MVNIDKISDKSGVFSPSALIIPSVERITQIASCVFQVLKEGICSLGNGIQNFVQVTWSRSQIVFIPIREMFHSTLNWSRNLTNYPSVENRSSVLQPSLEAVQMTNRLASGAERESPLALQPESVNPPLPVQIPPQLPAREQQRAIGAPASRSFSIRNSHSGILEAARLLNELLRRCIEISSQTQIKMRSSMTTSLTSPGLRIEEDYFHVDSPNSSTVENPSSEKPPVVEAVECRGASFEQLRVGGNQNTIAPREELRHMLSDVVLSHSPQPNPTSSQSSTRGIDPDAQLIIQTLQAQNAQKDETIARLEGVISDMQQQMDRMQAQMQVLINAVTANPPAAVAPAPVVVAPAPVTVAATQPVPVAQPVRPVQAAQPTQPVRTVTRPSNTVVTAHQVTQPPETLKTVAARALILSATFGPYLAYAGGVPGFVAGLALSTYATAPSSSKSS